MKLIEPGGRETEVPIGANLCGIALTKVRISAAELGKFIAVEGRGRWFRYRDEVLMTRFAPGHDGIEIEGSEVAPAEPK